MTGGTPLFATSPIGFVRGLAGALLLLIIIAFVVVEVFGQDRYGPEVAMMSTVTATETMNGFPVDR